MRLPAAAAAVDAFAVLWPRKPSFFPRQTLNHSIWVLIKQSL
jgi:hypothetical protein